MQSVRNCGENLFVKRFLPAPLSKNFYIMAIDQLPLSAAADQSQDMEFPEEDSEETFLPGKISSLLKRR